MITRLADPSIDRVITCLTRHGWMYTYWCLRRQGIRRSYALKMVWVAYCRARYEFYTQETPNDG